MRELILFAILIFAFVDMQSSLRKLDYSFILKVSYVLYSF